MKKRRVLRLKIPVAEVGGRYFYDGPKYGLGVTCHGHKSIGNMVSRHFYSILKYNGM